MLYLCSVKQMLHILWLNYKSEVIFGSVLLSLTVLSYWLGAFMPEYVFDNYINQIQYISTATVCFFGAGLLFAHLEHNTLRRSWAIVLLIWGCVDIAMWVMQFVLHIRSVGGTPSDPLFNASVTLGNILAFLLFIYPTQVLRPGWLNLRRGFLILTPMIVTGILDYFVPMNLLYVTMTYPAVIFIMLCRHIRKYRQWCEDNFSTMDDIDVQWIVRYLTMLFIVGVAFYFIVFWYVPNRMFTQQWTLILILAYTTERVLYRPDPWTRLRTIETTEGNVEELHSAAAYRENLDAWMDAEKPYLNPDLQLLDLRRVVPLNRTYLSQFINAEYGCSFYHWVNGLRVAEAKRIITEHPEMTLEEVSKHCGFSSRRLFTQIFARATGMTPREWSKKG